MNFWLLSLFFYVLVEARPGELKLKPDSEDNLETRQKVKHILSRMKVKSKVATTTPKPQPQKREVALSSKQFPAPEIAPPSVGRGRIDMTSLNQNVSEWMYEGDMLLSIEQAEKIAEENSKNGEDAQKSRRAATTDPNYYWNPDTPIYYVIDKSIQNDARKLPVVKRAVQYWQDNTCLNFQNSNGPNALNYYIGSGCWSYVGKQPGWSTQQVSIGNGCESFGTVCHETAHALGFYHEQSRYDRDQFVSINLSNIAANLQYNFVKMTSKTSTNLDVPYDYSSVMQYDPYAFATNRDIPTITPKDENYLLSLGQRESPAFSDVVSVNNLYNCSSRCSSIPNCQNSGIVNSRKCSECLCPRQFTGPTCSQLAKGTAISCNGQTLQATSSSWQTFNGTAGDPSDYTPLTKANDCYWLIQAPTGKKIQFQVTRASTCQQSCPWQAFEINLGNFLLGGMLLCCETSTFTSTSNQISIRGLSYYNQLRFSFQYRVV